MLPALAVSREMEIKPTEHHQIDTNHQRPVNQQPSDLSAQGTFCSAVQVNATILFTSAESLCVLLEKQQLSKTHTESHVGREELSSVSKTAPPPQRVETQL